MKNPARACARRGSVNLPVDAGTLYPAESPSLPSRSAPNLCSGRMRRAQYRGRVANNMAAILAKDMFSPCVMVRDINGRPGTCNPFRTTFFESDGISKFTGGSPASNFVVGLRKLRRVAAQNSTNDALQLPCESPASITRRELKISSPKKESNRHARFSACPPTTTHVQARSLRSASGPGSGSSSPARLARSHSVRFVFR
jgi:hypothetical protein